MPKLNLHNALIALAIVAITIKFRNQIAAAFAKVPVVGPFIVT